MQGFKIQGFKDSRIQGFKDSRIQGFKIQGKKGKVKRFELFTFPFRLPFPHRIFSKSKKGYLHLMIN